MYFWMLWNLFTNIGRRRKGAWSADRYIDDGGNLGWRCRQVLAIKVAHQHLRSRGPLIRVQPRHGLEWLESGVVRDGTPKCGQDMTVVTRSWLELFESRKHRPHCSVEGPDILLGALVGGNSRVTRLNLGSCVVSRATYRCS